MKIGGIDLEKRMILAPMAEITDAPFRKIAKEFGAGLTFTQMVSAKGIIENQFNSLRYLAFNKNEKPIGVQLLGNDPHLLHIAVKEIKNLKPDLIDINCGCPVKKVCDLKMGANILENPILLGKLVNNMVSAAGNIPVSVKLRLGKDRKNINVLENAKAAKDNGAYAVIVHARAAVDRYNSEAEWNWIKKIKDEVNIKVIGNGSIFSPQDALKLKQETGCDSVMAARGALGNPFIFKRFNALVETGIDPGPPKPEDSLKTALRHIKFLRMEYADNEALRRSKKQLIWYFLYYQGINHLIEKIFSFKDFDHLEEYLREHVEKIKTEKYNKIDLKKISARFQNRVSFWLDPNKEEMLQSIL